MTHKSLALGAALALVTFTGGCSVAFVTPAKDKQNPVFEPRCTDSEVAPGADGVVTAAGLIWTGAAIVDGDRYRTNPDARTTTIAVGALATAVSLGSAIYGHNQTHRVQQAQGAVQERATAVAGAPRFPDPAPTPRAAARPDHEGH